MVEAFTISVSHDLRSAGDGVDEAKKCCPFRNGKGQH